MAEATKTIEYTMRSGEKIEFQIRHVNSPHVGKAQVASQLYGNAKDGVELQAQVLADGLVVGWKDVMSEGKQLEFNRSNFLALCELEPTLITSLMTEAIVPAKEFLARKEKIEKN